jgi:hypothetical protein
MRNSTATIHPATTTKPLTPSKCASCAHQLDFDFPCGEKEKVERKEGIHNIVVECHGFQPVEIELEVA